MRWIHLSCLLALFVCLFSGCDSAPRRELHHAVYVWQRTNSPALEEALAALPSQIVGLQPLAGEIRFAADGTAVAELPGLTFEGSRPEDALVVRIDDSGAATGWNESACESVANFCRQIEWRAGEIQIDYDCPQSKLGDYARLLAHLREELHPARLTITALPSWLYEADLTKVIQQTDGFVIQVHSLHLENELELLLPSEAKEAVRMASTFGKPFRVALPTYSSYVVFGANGQVLDVISEDLPVTFPGDSVKLLRSRPRQIAELVAAWSADPPENLDGFVWYRLPLSTDRMNWPLVTWQAVLNGEVPESRLVALLELSPRGFHNVVLHNRGSVPEPLPFRIQLGDPGRIVAADATEIAALSSPGVWELTESRVDPLPLNPGETKVYGWVRFRDPDDGASARLQFVRDSR